MGFLILAFVFAVGCLIYGVRFADATEGTKMLPPWFNPVTMKPLKGFKADGTARKVRTKRAEMTPEERQEGLRLRAAKAAKDRKNLAWDNAHAALERRPDLRGIAEGIATLRRFDREAEVYGDPEKEAEMLARLRARIDRVTQRAIVARSYAGRSKASIGTIERLFSIIGGRIVDALNAGECMSDAEVDAEVDSVLTSKVKTELSTLTDKSADPFGAFRRKTGDVSDEDAIPDDSGTDSDSDDGTDDGDDSEDSGE